jgi:ankyrin repeat protein
VHALVLDSIRYNTYALNSVRLPRQEPHSLSAAVTIGSIELVKILIEHKADIHYIDKIGSGVLSSAVSAGHIEIVQLLLDSGADANADVVRALSAFGAL